MFEDDVVARADRLLEYGWLMAVSDLVRMGEAEMAKALLADRGFNRAKIVAVDIDPWDKRNLLKLFPEPSDKVFVSGNHDPRVTVIGLAQPCVVLNHRAMRALRENI